MIFFVVITVPINNKKIFDIIQKSFILYIFFLILIKNDLYFFLTVLFITAIIYVLILRKNEIKEEMEKKKLKNDINDETERNDNVEELYIKEIDNIIFTNNCLFVLAIILTLIGFLIYMGKKKYEYKDEFRFLTFIFGKPICTGKKIKISMFESLKSSFS